MALSASLLLLYGCAGPGRPAGESGIAEASSKAEANGIAGTNGKAEEGSAGTAGPKTPAASSSEDIHINQIGYGTEAVKQVIVNGMASEFAVVDDTGGNTVYIGKLKKGIIDEASGDSLYYGDFTAVKSAGGYYIEVPGAGRSESFKIGDEVYAGLKDALLKFFYYQRCGMDLEQKFAGAWAHPACHTSVGRVYGDEGREMDGNGGWHDAGDYGRYTVPAASAAADLLMAWEFFPTSFEEDTNIPESYDSVPDVLDEARYEIGWLLKMQDPQTGGVFHKLTSKTFPPPALLPQDDLGGLYYSPVSAAATGVFTAVAATAARVYKAYDAVFSEKCLKAAEKGWSWLSNNADAPGFKNPGEISTGEYSDGNTDDERLWAAAELYRTTGSGIYGKYIKKSIAGSGPENFGFGWQQTEGFAGVAYLFTDSSKQDKNVYDHFKAMLIGAAKEKLKNSAVSGYGITLRPEDYYWGSNSVVLNDARLLIIADMLEPDGKYVRTAQQNFNYILGSNTLNQCYVTGFGHKTVKDPHHRPSKGDAVEAPVPGMVAGGPNKDLEDDIAKINLKKLPPSKCYIDNSGSYSTNEVAIYWNSPAVFVAAFFNK